MFKGFLMGFAEFLVGFTACFIMGLLCCYFIFRSGFHIGGIVQLYLLVSLFAGLFGGFVSVSEVKESDE